jgi:hypothetical protein
MGDDHFYDRRMKFFLDQGKKKTGRNFMPERALVPFISGCKSFLEYRTCFSNIVKSRTCSGYFNIKIQDGREFFNCRAYQE